MTWTRETRRAFCEARRRLTDWVTGRTRQFVSPNPGPPSEAERFPVRFVVRQAILPTDHVSEKLHNLRLAIQILDNRVLPPNRLFSFWRLVGRPTPKRGFQAGRSLLGGQLVTDYGGGLCQLSGIIYHTVLLAGLKIVERHPHSVDIYEDATRYTPLGADATVAFGFKDLRFVNSLTVPVALQFTLEPEQLSCGLGSPMEIARWEVQFVLVTVTPGERIVETRARRPDDVNETVLAVSRYRVAQRNLTSS